MVKETWMTECQRYFIGPRLLFGKTNIEGFACLVINPCARIRSEGRLLWSVGRFVSRFVRTFLSNRGCCRYQTWICGYVQLELGTARVWSGIVQEQHVYGGGLQLHRKRSTII